MRLATRGVAALTLLLSPLAVAASDPVGDAGPCPDAGAGAGATGGAPDLIAARAQIVELGTSAVWTLEFDRPLPAPGSWRVDVLLVDADAPRVSFGGYEGINRLIRYRSSDETGLRILLLPEAARNTFSAPTLDGATLRIQVPGRILSADEDETGTSPGLEDLRWSVVLRQAHGCDALSDGRALQRFTSPSTPVSSPQEAGQPGRWWIAPAVLIAMLAVGRAAQLAWRTRT